MGSVTAVPPKGKGLLPAKDIIRLAVEVLDQLTQFGVRFGVDGVFRLEACQVVQVSLPPSQDGGGEDGGVLDVVGVQPPPDENIAGTGLALGDQVVEAPEDGRDVFAERG